MILNFTRELNKKLSTNLIKVDSSIPKERKDSVIKKSSTLISSSELLLSSEVKIHEYDDESISKNQEEKSCLVYCCCLTGMWVYCMHPEKHSDNCLIVSRCTCNTNLFRVGLPRPGNQI